MTFCLPLAYWKERAAKKAAPAANGTAAEPLLGSNGENGAAATTERPRASSSSLREVLLLSLPSIFDLIATILMNVGLLSVTASVYQMMRGAEMLFAAVFAVSFLGRRLNRRHYQGIAACAVGIGAVGASSLLGGEGSSTHVVSTSEMLTGMGLIVLSQAVQAAQLTFEDFFMADLNMEPLKIVGFEGLYGSALMLGVLLPLAQVLPGPEGLGFHEDSRDTWDMIKNSPQLATVLAVDMAALLLYNVSGMLVTSHLGAVFRTVLETMRTLFVWLLGLLLYYTPLGGGRLGESWTRWSPLQAAGFVVLVWGTLLYGQGDEQDAREAAAEAAAAATASGGGASVLAGGGGTTTDQEDADAERQRLLLEDGGAAGEARPASGGGMAAPPPTAPVGFFAAPPPTTAPTPIMSASLRASMTMTAGSFSHRGSLPRGGGPGAGSYQS
jgi:hypothetical protein